ncbi:MAG: hypothetical protein KAY46_23110, partial [Burkholderiaceae bacterium]|nr:hypothetical protein [Burkholderiaceae bacterium]
MSKQNMQRPQVQAGISLAVSPITPTLTLQTMRHSPRAVSVLALCLTLALAACGDPSPAGPEVRPIWTSPERATGLSPAAYREGVFYVIVDVDGRAVLRAQSETT